ncbi:MAG: hypothetical protein FWF90_10220 [Promicromonosporaceae bacterium]|nr:hypothetical protein [Promicromonosporaceae bacterium]
MTRSAPLIRPLAAATLGFMAALLAVSGLLGAGPAQAFWTDTAAGSQTLTAGTVPAPSLSCPTPTLGNNHVATWTPPSGVTVTGYQAVLTGSPSPTPWQPVGAGTPGATIIGGTFTFAPGTTQAVWGVQGPGLLSLGVTYNGTFTVQTIVGQPGTAWFSAAATVNWQIVFGLAGVGVSVSCG